MSTLVSRRAVRGLPSQGDLVAALDIGTSKITCLIGRIDQASAAGYNLVGGGRQQSRGFSGGAITDMEALERAIRLAVEDAERQAGERIEAVRLGLTGPKLSGTLLSAGIAPGGREVSRRDVRRVQAKAMAKLNNKDAMVISVYPVAYRVDSLDGVREPIGMVADRLGVLLHVITAPVSLVRNLQACISRAHLKVDRIVPAAIASGYGTLIADERENGAICVDMGAGLTAVSVFLNGAPAALDLVSAGGGHVTSDLAQGLGTTFAAAERMKTVFGHAHPMAPGLAERIECPRLGDDGRLKATRMPRAGLTEIIGPRIEEVFEIIQTKLANSPLKNVMPRRVVLTGGASQLPGIREVSGQLLSMPVRMGRPVHAEILGESLGSPGFSTAAGLLEYGLREDPEATWAGRGGDSLGRLADGGRTAKTWSWLRENF